MILSSQSHSRRTIKVNVIVTFSYALGTRGREVRCQYGSQISETKREVLHTASRDHRDVVLHVEVDERSQVPRLGLGCSAGYWTLFFQ